jgi:hypothetical protein
MLVANAKSLVSSQERLQEQDQSLDLGSDVVMRWTNEYICLFKVLTTWRNESRSLPRNILQSSSLLRFLSFISRTSLTWPCTMPYLVPFCLLR